MSLRRIAFVHPLLGYGGGAENLILWTAEELSRRGYGVKAYCQTLPREKPPFIELEQVDMDLKILKWKKAGRTLARGLAHQDAIIFHNFPASIYVNLAAGSANALPPRYYYCHEPRRSLYGLDEKEGEAIRRRQRRRLDFSAWNNRRMDRNAVRSAHGAMANSLRTARYAQKVFGRNFSVAYPGLPEDRLDNAMSMASRDRFVFLGRLHHAKNVYGVLEAYENFLGRTGRKDIDLWIIGEGEEKNRAEAWGETRGIASRVHFTGFLPQGEVEAQLDKALAVLNVNQGEPFGLVTLECWARGTPVILSADSGSAEVAQNGTDALFVDPQSTDGMAMAMERLASETRLADSMAEAGRRKVAASFLIRHHVDRILEIMRGST